MRILTFMGLVAAALTMFAAAPAFADTFVDDYIGADAHGYGDRIGSSIFEIHGAEVTTSGNSLVIDIRTNYAEAFATYDNTVGGAPMYGTSIGALFLSSNGWNPDGTNPAGAPNGYTTDDSSNGELWEIVLSVDQPDSPSTSGSGNVYTLVNSVDGVTGDNILDGGILLSEDVMPGGLTFRNGQEAAYDSSTGEGSLVAGVTSGWSLVNTDADDDYEVIRFTLTQNGLWTTGLFAGAGPTIGAHWGMTCQNEVIEFGFNNPVPEPTSLALMAGGLLGAGFLRRRRRRG